MRQICILLVIFQFLVIPIFTADLSNASSQDLLAVYQQLRMIQGNGEAATTENVVFKRDSATFTFLSGRMTFAAPIAGRVLAAQFKGEGKFELEPASYIDKRQISRFGQGNKLTDTFREAVFYFTDDSYAVLSKLMKLQPASNADDANAFISHQKQYREAFNNWVENQRKGNPAMRNMAARMLADLTDNASKGFFLADFKGKDSGDLLFHISWNRDSLLLPDLAKGEEVILLHLNPGNYFEWWCGFHLISEYAQTPYPDHRTFLARCSSVIIDMQLKDNTIAATADLEYSVTEGAPRIIPFNLNGVLRISSIDDSAGGKIGFIQEDRKLDNDPWLILPEPAKPGVTGKIKIAYKEDSTRDSRVVYQQGSGLYYVTSRESWFPSFGSYDDRTQFELRARSPKRYKFIASGSLTSSEKVKDELATTWKSDIPFGVFGFNYGDFVEASQPSNTVTITAYSGKDVPNELKGLEADMSVLELLGESRAVNQSGIMRGGFNTAANVKQAAAISSQAFRFFEFLFGPLPYKTISVTEQPVRGYGQSWPNLIFLPYDAFLDATTRNSLGLQDSGVEREFFNLVAVHEMAHQWWGHLVGWKTYHDEWLSEGFAEFASSMYLRQFEPKLLNSFWDTKRFWLLSKNQLGYRPVDAGPIWLNNQLDKKNAASSNLIYYKGAYVLEMLRILLYDPNLQNPDARFIAMMKDYAKTYAGQNASTEDFRKITEKHIKEPMKWFFDQWVYGSDIPAYNFSYKLSDAGGGQTELAMTITQSGVGEGFQMRLPLYMVVQGALRYLGTINAVGTKPFTTQVKLPLRPEKVLLDPGRSILAAIQQ